MPTPNHPTNPSPDEEPQARIYTWDQTWDQVNRHARNIDIEPGAVVTDIPGLSAFDQLDDYVRGAMKSTMPAETPWSTGGRTRITPQFKIRGFHGHFEGLRAVYLDPDLADLQEMQSKIVPGTRTITVAYIADMVSTAGRGDSLPDVCYM